ncbi:MAG: hypothetical protein GVX78_02455, partial [Bacteroidetes bacterium]|nr:hypothetical protein [Bacteroidota bacterium]
EPIKITFVESRGNTSVLHFRNEEPYLDTRTLKIYEALLPHYFYRVHRSYIANTREVVEIISGDGNRVVLKNGRELPISRERKKKFMEKMNL